ncbi:mechanosensitive ion channel [Rhabdobacter roseus]|uniref:ABC-type multidrug transport system fused ATPase/permease subunit n=1 Tax=Rhabdobacter roseus TaxID=1655419 RepID=A0A840TTB9_9BACT|nr:mechanosensitive ion channel [Rhabdobacter roseus]MBB5284802.1 ABC-type multidrug transport system fused ATPase/permease subunit [Rhabdobacter roseus]
MKTIPNLSEILINTFNTLINQFVDFVPRLIGCGVIILVGYLVAKSVSLVVRNLLGRIGFDRVGEKLNEIGIIKQLKAEIRLSLIIAKVLYYFILLVFLTAATETLGVDAITSMVLSLVNFIPKLIAAAIMLQVGIMLADAIKSAVTTLCKSFNVPSATLIGNLVFVFFLVITFISSLGQIGINTQLLESSFNLILGGIVVAFALGYGLSSRDVLANMIASFYTRNKYQEGQVVQIDEVRGTIVEVDSTSITVQHETTRTVIPLQQFQNKKVEIHG